jgi:hypothetical protein
MRKVLFFLSLLGVSPLFHCQTVVSTCTATDSIVKLYRKSADKLAVRRSEYVSDTYKDSVSINKQLSDKYLRALLAVYNATSLAARDTVVVVPIIVDYYIPHDLNSILVGGDSSKMWVKNLKDDLLPCGNPSVDYLITKYHLKKTGYSYGYIFPFNLSITFSFRTDSNCHINRLCDKFNSLSQQGVTSSQPNNENRSDNFNITDSINSNFTELTYSLGWGGCMIPCMYRRYWTFRVQTDCTVEYRGSYGDVLPFNIFAGVTDTKLTKENILLFPNPANDKVKISSSSQSLEDCDIELSDLSGKVVYSLCGFNCLNEMIDVTNLNSGLYFVRVQIGQNQIVKKLVVTK